MMRLLKAGIASISVILSGCATQALKPTPVPAPAIEPVVEILPEAPPPIVEPDNRTLSVIGVGDIMLGTDFPLNHLPDDDGVSFLEGVTETLQNADVTFGNLEQVLMDGGEPVKECKDPSACYLFRSPTRYAAHLKAAGFDVMSVANNHARDFGEEGRDSSMAALDAVGIHHSGREGTYASWIASDGLRVALMAFAPFKESNSPLALDRDKATAAIALLAGNHDIVIVSLHGGAEGVDVANIPFEEEYYRGELRGDVVAFSRAMVDAGADLVIGHGPHVPRAMEIYQDRLIAYSLGNFATYYGISVAGIKGVAPILKANLRADGSLIDGKIISAVQLRPGGPYLDQRNRAYNEIVRLTIEDFNGGGLLFLPDGGFQPDPLAVVTEGFVTVDDGTKLYYVEQGVGSDVLVAPVALYLEQHLLDALSQNRRVIFYDPRNRGQSDNADLASVSLDRQIADLEALRDQLGIEEMALLGWSSLGMEMAVYALRYPDRVTQLIQMSPVAPASSIMREAGDSRGQSVDRAAIEALDQQADAGAFDASPDEYCRLRYALSDPGSFVNTDLVNKVPDVCTYENEWPRNLWPYFEAFFSTFGDYDWRNDLESSNTPRLIIHGREDGIPLVGAEAWAAGYPQARLIVLSPSGHFPFIEQKEAVITAINTFLDGEWPHDASLVPAD